MKELEKLYWFTQVDTSPLAVKSLKGLRYSGLPSKMLVAIRPFLYWSIMSGQICNYKVLLQHHLPAQQPKASKTGITHLVSINQTSHSELEAAVNARMHRFKPATSQPEEEELEVLWHPRIVTHVLEDTPIRPNGIPQFFGRSSIKALQICYTFLRPHSVTYQLKSTLISIFLGICIKISKNVLQMRQIFLSKYLFIDLIGGRTLEKIFALKLPLNYCPIASQELYSSCKETAYIEFCDLR